jgi:orotidine-5'-phosphate decarboxylase
VNAEKAGLDGVVASVREVGRIREKLSGDFIVVTPGIRPAGKEKDDQKRVATPAEAARAGSDYLVIGRAITAADSPLGAAEAIRRELEGN